MPLHTWSSLDLYIEIQIILGQCPVWREKCREIPDQDNVSSKFVSCKYSLSCKCTVSYLSLYSTIIIVTPYSLVPCSHVK